ncbi:MAG TPA: hypothetical protein VIT22_06035 [Pseudoxanthomonas sp.]
MSALKRAIKAAGGIVVFVTALLCNGEASAQASLSAFENISWGASESTLRQSSFGKNLLIKQCTANEAARDMPSARRCGSPFLPHYRMPGAEFDVAFYMDEHGSLVRIRSGSMTTFSPRLIKDGFTAQRQYDTLKKFLASRWGEPVETNKARVPATTTAPATISESAAKWRVASSIVSLASLYFTDSSGKTQFSVLTIDYLPLDDGAKNAGATSKPPIAE